MSYRDERDALRERAEKLEQDLRDAKRDLAATRGDYRGRLARLGEQVGGAQHLLQQLRRESRRGHPSRRSRILATIAIVGWTLVVAGGTAFLRHRFAPPPCVPPPVGVDWEIDRYFHTR